MNFSDFNNFLDFRKHCVNIEKCSKKCFLFEACGEIPEPNSIPAPLQKTYFEIKFELLKVYFRKKKLEKLLK